MARQSRAPNHHKAASAGLSPWAAWAVEQHLVLGCRVHLDRRCPVGELHFVDEEGQVLLSVKGLA